MGEITYFVAMPFDLTSDGLVAGESAAAVPLGRIANWRACDLISSSD
jgi:hypothetical protein